MGYQDYEEENFKGYIVEVMTSKQYCEKYKEEGKEIEEGMKGSIHVYWDESEEEEAYIVEYQSVYKDENGILRKSCGSCDSIDCGDDGSYKTCTGSWCKGWVYSYKTKEKTLKELNKDKDIILNYDESIKQLKNINNN